MRTLFLASFVVACTTTTSDDTSTTDSGSYGVSDWQPVVYIDEGSVCFTDADPDVTVNVRAPGCLSSSCSRNLTGTCEATVEGDQITLTSNVEWEQDMGYVACTDDCGSPSVMCTIAGGLPDGTYTVTHGSETSKLTVPLSTDPCPYY